MYQPTPPFTYILTYTLYLHSYFTWCYCLTAINQVMHSDQIKMYPRQIKYYTLIYYSSLVFTIWPQLSHTSICGIICTFKSINVLYILYHMSIHICIHTYLCCVRMMYVYTYTYYCIPVVHCMHYTLCINLQIAQHRFFSNWKILGMFNILQFII